MHDTLLEFVSNGLAFILWLQQFRTPLLDIFFELMTFLGNAEAYLFILPIVYWLINKKWGQQLVLLLMLSNGLNILLKNSFKLPRPPATVNLLSGEPGYGLPSGHAMNPMAIWGSLAWQNRRAARWVLPVAASFIGLIAFSRLYLGVHYPADTVTGLLLGFLLACAWLWALPKLTPLIQEASLGQVMAGSFVVTLVMIFLTPNDLTGYPAEDAVSNAGLWFGASVGFFIEMRRVRFVVGGSWQQRGLRFAVGVVFVVVFWFGLRQVFALVGGIHWLDLLLRLIRYTITGLALSYLAPATFVQLGLAQTEDRKP